jgi:hypothetical protein
MELEVFMSVETPVSRARDDVFYRSREAAAYLKTGSMWYGFIFGLSYALVLWGQYTYLILKSSMSLPWLEIVLGIILCVLLWVCAGFLSSFKRSVAWVILLSALSAALTPWLVWLAKTSNENFVWFIDRQGWSFIPHFGEALQYRLFMISFWGIGIGAFSGLLVRWLMPHAWDLTTASGRTSLKSLGLFLLCLPLTILFGSVSSDLFHKDFFESLNGTYEAFSQFDPEETRRPFLTWRFGGKNLESNMGWVWPTGDFTLHLVDYDAETMDQFFFDAIYSDGSTVRCQGGSSSLQLCGNVNDTYQQIMDLMIQGGLNHKLGDLQCESCDPSIRSELLISLDRLRSNFTQSYDIYKKFQSGGAVSMTAQFDNGFILSCNFRGDDPIVVESCEESIMP